MKAPKCILNLIVVLFFTTCVHAQLADNSKEYYNKNNKISVELNITPSVPGFKAGVTSIDTASSKLKIWVSNSEGKKFYVRISGSGGVLWNSSVRDPYFSQVFDLSLLEDGDYVVNITAGRESFEKKVRMLSNNYVVRTVQVNK